MRHVYHTIWYLWWNSAAKIIRAILGGKAPSYLFDRVLIVPLITSSLKLILLLCLLDYLLVLPLVTYFYILPLVIFSKKYQLTIDLFEFAKRNILKKSLLLKSLETYKALMCKCCLVAYEKDTISLGLQITSGIMMNINYKII